MSEQTPADWLIQQFETGAAKAQRHGGHIRPIFQLLDDHPDDVCPVGHCTRWSGQAVWPEPPAFNSLTAGLKWSHNPDYVLMMEAA